MGGFLLVLLILGIIGGIVAAIQGSPAKRLNKKFIELGTLTGKSKQEIIAACGVPSSVSAVAGKTLCQWMVPGYHIALLFNGDVCEGVSHEARVGK